MVEVMRSLAARSPRSSQISVATEAIPCVTKYAGGRALPQHIQDLAVFLERFVPPPSRWRTRPASSGRAAHARPLTRDETMPASPSSSASAYRPTSKSPHAPIA